MRAAVLVGVCLLSACRPTAPAEYVPTADEVAWEAAHREESSDVPAALAGYDALCNRPTPYLQACFDRVRLLFASGEKAAARQAAVALIERYPDAGQTLSVVKRLRKSYTRANEHRDGVATLSSLGTRLEGTEIYDSILFEIARIGRDLGDVELEKASLTALVSKHDRWESQLWDDAVWRLAVIARGENRTDVEKRWIMTLLDADESSWLIGSYTSPHHDDALLRLAGMFMEASDPQAAAEVYDTAAKLESSKLRDEALIGAAEARAALGQISAACRRLATVVRRDTSNKYVERAVSLGDTFGCGSR